MLFFQNTAVVGGLLGENVVKSKSLAVYLAMQCKQQTLVRTWCLMDVFRDVQSRDLCLWKHRECLKRIRFY